MLDDVTAPPLDHPTNVPDSGRIVVPDVAPGATALAKDPCSERCGLLAFMLEEIDDGILNGRFDGRIAVIEASVRGIRIVGPSAIVSAISAEKKAGAGVCLDRFPIGIARRGWRTAR
jgi:hypothetical protein